jgi:hypothetical protein
MKDATPEIIALHAVYNSITNREFPLTMQAVFAWTDWRGKGFTEADLRLVVAHIKKLISQNRRRPESLRFHNLIDDDERFMEDLAEANALARKPKMDVGKAKVLAATGRESEPPTGPMRSVKDVIAAMRIAVNEPP